MRKEHNRDLAHHDIALRDKKSTLLHVVEKRSSIEAAVADIGGLNIN